MSAVKPVCHQRRPKPKAKPEIQSRILCGPPLSTFLPFTNTSFSSSMALLFLEALGALVLLLFIVWWTMFSGRKKGELPDATQKPGDKKVGDEGDEGNEQEGGPMR